jgi:hypothetical protein
MHSLASQDFADSRHGIAPNLEIERMKICGRHDGSEKGKTQEKNPKIPKKWCFRRFADAGFLTSPYDLPAFGALPWREF